MKTSVYGSLQVLGYGLVFYLAEFCLRLSFQLTDSVHRYCSQVEFGPRLSFSKAEFDHRPSSQERIRLHP